MMTKNTVGCWTGFQFPFCSRVLDLLEFHSTALQKQTEPSWNPTAKDVRTDTDLRR